MENEEKQEMEQIRDMFAGIALPGVIGKANLFASYDDMAKEAYDVAEAMIKERARRLGLTKNPNENASIH